MWAWLDSYSRWVGFGFSASDGGFGSAICVSITDGVDTDLVYTISGDGWSITDVVVSFVGLPAPLVEAVTVLVVNIVSEGSHSLGGTHRI